MKKTFLKKTFLLSTVFIFFFSIQNADAAVEENVEFNLKLANSITYPLVDIIKFETDFISGSEDFGFFKVRFECDDGMLAFVEGSISNSCNSVNSQNSLSIKGGKIAFIKKDNSKARAKINFLAFNKNGELVDSKYMNFLFR